jgi:hypothetical protein
VNFSSRDCRVNSPSIGERQALPNNGMQRTALRAAADAERWAPVKD